MKPVEFPEANRTLSKPKGWTDSECGSLPCWGDKERNISKWRMTWPDRLRVLFTGVVWLHCYGFMHPPVAVDANHPFKANVKKWYRPGWFVKWRLARSIAKAVKEAPAMATV